jgi:hypothetical protein
VNHPISNLRSDLVQHGCFVYAPPHKDSSFLPNPLGGMHTYVEALLIFLSPENFGSERQDSGGINHESKQHPDGHGRTPASWSLSSHLQVAMAATLGLLPSVCHI